MRAVVQRVSSASVEVGGEPVGSIGPGLCALIGVTHADTVASADKLASKLWNLRVFEDPKGLMNLSAAELGLPVLVVSQFTLYADTTRGRRPSFVAAAPPNSAEALISRLVESLRSLGATVETGRF
ncbi:MAG TPA: D-aminoacyl-tRNA deacylase, partial [Acidimicrobiales bacterium]|nr:D-aminoacyl-tRNA deacylase [Acidimicrobiales bacterium]